MSIRDVLKYASKITKKEIADMDELILKVDTTKRADKIVRKIAKQFEKGIVDYTTERKPYLENASKLIEEFPKIKKSTKDAIGVIKLADLMYHLV